MPLTSLSLSGFTAFDEADFDFASGVNVFMGPNGTGKTHALKLMYATLRALANVGGDEMPAASVRRKLAGVFRPDDLNVGRLVRRVQGKGSAGVKVTLSDGSIGYRIVQARTSPIRDFALQGSIAVPSVFLPSREVLALFEGFATLYAAREIAVDETYADAIAALDLPPLRGARPGVLGSVARDLEDAISGQVRRDGPRFYVMERSGAKVEAHLAAEGHRKIATLLSLIGNGSLRDQAALFWDEPEANLHPLLARTLVRAVHQLAAAGVQIFIATHDYFIAKELSLVAEAGGAPVRFFSLRRNGKALAVESADRLEGIGSDLLLHAISEHNRFQREMAIEAIAR